METFCEFSYDPCEKIRVYYTCFINNQNIPENTELKIMGEHKYGNTNNDVGEVNFASCNISKIPKGLTKIFPNMASLSICGSNLRNINKNDLIEYKNLEIIALPNNNIEFLPGDLFEGFENLTDLSLVGNKLEVIEPTILDRLGNLKLVDFSNNPNYTLYYSGYPEYLGNATLFDVKNELRVNYQENAGNNRNFQGNLVNNRNLQGNPLNNQNFLGNPRNPAINRNLQENYEKEIEDLKKRINDLTQELQDFQEAGGSSQPDSQVSMTIKQEPEPKVIQNVQKSIYNDIDKFLQDDNFKDFKIIIDEREFQAHKFLLAARSPTLAELFLNNPGLESLNLVDISVEIFEEIFIFLYTDELPCEDEKNYFHLFAAAGRLKIEELLKILAVKIGEQVNDENALEVLNLSNKFDNDELRQKAFSQIKKCYPKIELMDELAFDTNKVIQAVEFQKQKQEAIKKMEEKFKEAKLAN